MVAELKISDGSENISLLNKEVGFLLKEWTRTVIPQNVTYRQSPLQPGRRPVSAVYGTTEETFSLVVRGHGQDELIGETQKLLRLLNKSLDFWITDWQDEVVSIQARAACETNLEYAEIVSFRIPELGKSFQQPFYSISELAALDSFTLIIERKHWKASAPGTGACTEVSGVQEWQYEEEWQVNTALPSGSVSSLIQTANGYIYAGDNGQILRSIDNGASWAVNTALPTGYVYSLIQTANGDIYAGDNGQILRSIDNGGSWQVNTVLPTGYVYSLIQAANGDIYAGEDSQILRSIDNGGSWQVNTTLPTDFVLSLLQTTPDSYIYAGEKKQILRSIDNGGSWQVNTTLPPSYVLSLLQTTNGDIYSGEDGRILRSIDNGASWGINTTLPTGDIFSLLQAANGYIYAGDNGQILRSIDNGVSWQVDITLPTGDVASLLQAANGYIYAGDNGNILWLRPFIADMGRSATCLNEVYIANKQNIGNFTHIKIDDGGVFTDIFPIAAYPQTLLPAIPVINDALYLGQEISEPDTGPFGSAVFDIDTPSSSTTSYVLTYEYWNGAWVALTAQDNTAVATEALRLLGVNSVHWEQPSDWVTTAVDGVTGYWIRIRLSALSGTMTPPTQENRNIYTIVYPYVNIADTVVVGDIPALLQAKLTNRSDADGRGSSGPDLWDNRIVAGLRSYSRGDLFQAYLNISDVQQPTGVTVTLGANTTFSNDTRTPTGRKAIYNNVAAPDAMATRATVSLGPTIARDFYGSFHAYLRARRNAGSAAVLDVQLQVATGSGGISFTTDSKQLQVTTIFEVLDLGVITIPASGSLKSSDLGDITEIQVKAGVTSAGPTGLNILELYDLILIPTDEWAGDFVDFTNSTDSIVGRDDDLAKLLDIDSVTDPQKQINSLVRQADTDLITSNYNSITNGAAILQANAQQRLWFFIMQTDSTGDYDAWIAPPEIAHSVQLFHNARYLGLRGTD